MLFLQNKHRAKNIVDITQSESPYLEKKNSVVIAETVFAVRHLLCFKLL